MERLIYLYGLIPSEEATQKEWLELQGFSEQSKIYTTPVNEVSAVVCDLDTTEYSEENIKKKIDHDMEWLKEKAYHHHETLISLYKDYTVIPLKFCTIYNSHQSLVETIGASEEKIGQAFKSIKGNEEWNLKIYCDEDRLRSEISRNHPDVVRKKEEIQTMTPGRRFFEMKKIDQFIENELDKEKKRVGEELHERLKGFSLQAEIKRNWNKDVTGLKETMAWNSVFLLPNHRVDAYLQDVETLENDLRKNGWKLEATGPWPAYHFSNFN
jgi:hypothetical protein